MHGSRSLEDNWLTIQKIKKDLVKKTLYIINYKIIQEVFYLLVRALSDKVHQNLNVQRLSINSNVSSCFLLAYIYVLCLAYFIYGINNSSSNSVFSDYLAIHGLKTLKSKPQNVFQLS